LLRFYRPFGAQFTFLKSSKQASQDLHKALDVKPPWSLDAYYADEARYYLKEIEDHHTT
jgi:hypothetical protein